MKKASVNRIKQDKSAISGFVTEFQKNCISRISDLYKKKNNVTRFTKILGCISAAACFVCTALLALKVVLMFFRKRNSDIISAVSVALSSISLISIIALKKTAEKEEIYQRDIELFEDAVNSAEEICGEY